VEPFLAEIVAGLDLRLEVRGEMGPRSLLRAFGWQVVGTWPGALQFTRHGRRDEVLMARDLTGERAS
jgi:hypothetical protein